MSNTYTTSSTFTRTNASYLASKVAADLRQVQHFYGKPSDQSISDYVAELVEMLVGGYLESIEYGFKKGGQWVFVLRYKVISGTISSTDDRSGRVPADANVQGADWYSFRTTNSKYAALSESEQSAVDNSHPIKRSSGTAPTIQNGAWEGSKEYSSNLTINRGIYKAQ